MSSIIICRSVILSPQACAHVFFDELRDPRTTLPNGAPLPPGMFEFTPEELRDAEHLEEILVPSWVPKPAASGADGPASGH